MYCRRLWLDNACKWARSRVSLTCWKAGEQMVIAVDDDGPGIPASMREAVLQRGVRADEAVQGTGLGLAIVRDVAESMAGRFRLSRRHSAARGRGSACQEWRWGEEVRFRKKRPCQRRPRGLGARPKGNLGLGQKTD